MHLKIGIYMEFNMHFTNIHLPICECSQYCKDCALISPDSCMRLTSPWTWSGNDGMISPEVELPEPNQSKKDKQTFEFPSKRLQKYMCFLSSKIIFQPMCFPSVLVLRGIDSQAHQDDRGICKMPNPEMTIHYTHVTLYIYIHSVDNFIK